MGGKKNIQTIGINQVVAQGLEDLVEMWEE